MSQETGTTVKQDTQVDIAQMSNEDFEKALDSHIVQSENPVQEPEIVVPVDDSTGESQENDTGDQNTQVENNNEAAAPAIDPRLEGTGYNSIDTAINGVKHYRKVYNDQTQELGELRKFKEEHGAVQTPSQINPMQPNNFQNQNQEIDYSDPQQIQLAIQNGIKVGMNQITQQVNGQLNQINQTLGRQNQTAHYELLKKESEALMKEHPELKINDYDNAINTVMEAAKTGQDPQLLHEEAGKASYLIELMKIRQKNNNIAPDMSAAHEVMTVRKNGINGIRADARQQGTLDAVNHIAGKQNGAKTLTKVGGVASGKKKSLQELTNDELETSLQAAADQF